MKKKLFLLLLIVALAAFVFTGCTPPAEGEGEGEGEGEVTEPTIEIDGGYAKGQYTFVQKGKTYDVTVSFPTPTSNVELSFECEVNDLTKAIDVEGLVGLLEPVEGTNKTVWTGKFTFNGCGDTHNCSLGYLYAEWGECDVDCYARIPVIVDGDKPYAKINVTVDDCCCDNCEITLKSAKDTEGNLCDPCGPTGSACCEDDCSGLASWKVDIYSWDGRGQKPFPDGTQVDCCTVPPCLDLEHSCEGVGCPIECVTECLDVNWAKADTNNGNLVPQPKDYYAVITLKDNVGNTQTYYAEITVSLEENADGEYKCKVSVQEYCCVYERISGGILKPTIYGWRWRMVEHDSEDNKAIGACDGANSCANLCSLHY